MDKYEYLDLSMSKDAAYRAIQYVTTLDDNQKFEKVLDQTLSLSVQRTRNIERRISLPASRKTKTQNVTPNVVSNILTDIDQTRITKERDIFSIKNILLTNIAKSTVISNTSSHSRVTSTPSTNTHSVLSSQPSKYSTDSSNFYTGIHQNYHGNYRSNRAGLRTSQSMATVVMMNTDPDENIITWKVILCVVLIVTLLSIPLFIVMMAVEPDEETEI